MLRRRPTATVTDLESHPNVAGILGVMAQLAHLEDHHLVRLASGWTNSAAIADARDRALSPDSPLVLEALMAFEAVGEVFADDLAGAAWITLDPAVTSVALRTVRDAIAASYAAPVLTTDEQTLLMAPWLAVFPHPLRTEPDLGPQQKTLTLLVGALAGVATHCHDDAAQEQYELLADHLFLAAGDRAEARDAAWQAIILTHRRRVWTLLRRTATVAFSRPCPRCGPRTTEEIRADHRVLEICLDGARALLVSDALTSTRIDLLTLPLRVLVPLPRTAL